jgi:MFS family permease
MRDGRKRETVGIHAAFRALRHRNFRLFAGGQLVSLIGTWMQTVAQSWLVYRMTGSSLLLGTVGFASQIPVFLVSPIGGLVADRYDRRHIVMATQAASMALAGVLALLTLGGHVRVWHVMVISAALGVVNAFDIPARQAFLVEMVGKQDLMNAIALNSSMFNGARVVGPGIAGLLVAGLGEGWCFLLNALSYVAVLAGLGMMDIAPRETEAHESAVDALLTAVRFVWTTAPIRALLLLLGLVSVMGMPYTVLMPVFADKVLHGGAKALGILMSAVGIGALTGALLLAARSSVRGLGRWVATAAAGFGVSMIVFALSPLFWMSAVLLVPTGAFMMVQMASSNTLVQAMVPDALRGRVMALYSMMFMGMAPLGSLFAGAAADRIGAPWTVAIGGAACLIGAGWFALSLPAFRGEARRLIVAQGLTSGDPVQELVGSGVPVDSQK